jgi:hypothetical protein
MALRADIHPTGISQTGQYTTWLDYLRRGSHTRLTLSQVYGHIIT